MRKSEEWKNSGNPTRRQNGGMEEWKNLGLHIFERSVLNDPLFWKYIILFYQNNFAPPERTNIEQVKYIYATPWSGLSNSSIIHFSVLQVFHSSIPSFFRCVRFPKFFRFSRGSGFHLRSECPLRQHLVVRS